MDDDDGSEDEDGPNADPNGKSLNTKTPAMLAFSGSKQVLVFDQIP